MVENENYKNYTANNGTELRFPKESVIQMTAEQSRETATRTLSMFWHKS